MSVKLGVKKDFKQEIFNSVNENVKALESLFPSAVKDGQVDFKVLKEELGQFEEVDKEKYELTWSGKQNAKKQAQQDILGKTLKYIPEDSKNPETTENLYIEGNNLEVLKLLRQNYYGSIKMIYIDPPYNTGNDFIYNDKFSMTKEESDIQDGTISELGERYTVNKDTSNKYHANWLNMMYPRLKVAKDLLTDDGVIFISIANEEQANLKKICDEVFGEENFIETFIWTKTSTPPSLSAKSRKIVEYVLCYEKHKNNIKYKGELLVNGDAPLLKNGNNIKILQFPKETIKFNIQDGVYKNGSYDKIKLLDDLIVEEGLNKNTVRIEGEFVWTQDKLNQEINEGTYFIVKSDKFSIRFQRLFKKKDYKTPTNFINDKQVELELNSKINIGTNETSGKELQQLDLRAIFNYTKPTSLIKYLVNFICKKDDIILDFFSGSSTTAHAIMQLNAEDGGNRKFIMVQLPEECDEKSEAYKAGYKNICEIGKERIRRAGEKIKEENKDKEGIEDLDVGFKVFIVGDTNIRWNYETVNSSTLNMFKNIENSLGEEVASKALTPLEEQYYKNKDGVDFMPNSKDIDIVYEILLRQRDIPLSEKVELLENIGERTYLFADSYLVCLEKTITKELIEKIASLDPLPIKFVFRDSAFEDNISLKDEAIRRLKALIDKNSEGNKVVYTVEFI